VDDLNLIRTLRPDPRTVDLESRDRARARLERHAAGRRDRRRPSRLPGLIAAALLLAGAVTVALLGDAQKRPFFVAGPGTAAAELLREAATAARAAPQPPALRTGYWYSRVDRLEARGGPYRHDLRFREERWTNLEGRGRVRLELRGVRFPTAPDRQLHDRQGAPFTKRPFDVQDTGANPARAGTRIGSGWLFGNNLFDLRALRALPTDPAALGSRVRRLSGKDGDVFGDLSRVLADAPLSPAMRASGFEVLARLDGLRVAQRPAGLERLPPGTVFVGRRNRIGNVDTVVALDPRAGTVVAQVSVLVRASGRGGRGRFRTGDRIGEYVWGPSGAVASTLDRP